MLEMKPSMMIYRKKKIWEKQITHTTLMNVMVTLERANFEKRRSFDEKSTEKSNQ